MNEKDENGLTHFLEKIMGESTFSPNLESASKRLESSIQTLQTTLKKQPIPQEYLYSWPLKPAYLEEIRDKLTENVERLRSHYLKCLTNEVKAPINKVYEPFIRKFIDILDIARELPDSLVSEFKIVLRSDRKWLPEHGDLSFGLVFLYTNPEILKLLKIIHKSFKFNLIPNQKTREIFKFRKTKERIQTFRYQIADEGERHWVSWYVWDINYGINDYAYFLDGLAVIKKDLELLYYLFYTLRECTKVS